MERHEEGDLRSCREVPSIGKRLNAIDPARYVWVVEFRNQTSTGLYQRVMRIAVFVWKPQLCLDLGHDWFRPLTDESPFRGLRIFAVDSFRCKREASVVHEPGLGEKDPIYLDWPARLDRMKVYCFDTRRSVNCASWSEAEFRIVLVCHVAGRRGKPL